MKVLVLGAGASLAYGFPLGSGLRREILAIPTEHAVRAGILPEHPSTRDVERLNDFKEAFRSSQLYSIDAFLARRPEFSEIGKKCIATALLLREDPAHLFEERNDKDHWYQYFFNHLAQSSWDDLTFDELAIITFNYDRSLEYFLFTTLQYAYGKSPEEVREKLRTLTVNHAYGCLCDKLPGDVGYLAYDGSIAADKVETAATHLIVIPEGRVDSPTLVRARELLAEAESICFLGFGFDPLNVERLAANDACHLWKQRANGLTMRTIAGTRLGMTDLEISTAYVRLASRMFNEYGQTNFHNVGCTQLLRETLVLR